MIVRRSTSWTGDVCPPGQSSVVPKHSTRPERSGRNSKFASRPSELSRFWVGKFESRDQDHGTSEKFARSSRLALELQSVFPPFSGRMLSKRHLGRDHPRKSNTLFPVLETGRIMRG